MRTEKEIKTGLKHTEYAKEQKLEDNTPVYLNGISDALRWVLGDLRDINLTDEIAMA